MFLLSQKFGLYICVHRTGKLTPKPFVLVGWYNYNSCWDFMNISNDLRKRLKHPHEFLLTGWNHYSEAPAKFFACKSFFSSLSVDLKLLFWCFCWCGPVLINLWNIVRIYVHCVKYISQKLTYISIFSRFLVDLVMILILLNNLHTNDKANPKSRWKAVQYKRKFAWQTFIVN